MEKWWSFRSWHAVVGGVVVLLAYAVAAVTVLPQWVVASQIFSAADPNTQLNAITTTRVALLGVLTPVVVIIGGVFAALSYSETVRHNRRTDALARRQRRADVYAEMISAWDECVLAARAIYYGRSEDPKYFLLMTALLEKRATMDRVSDRLTLLGSDAVRAAADALAIHTGLQVATKACEEPKQTEVDRKRMMSENAGLYSAFLLAARSDLEPTR